jgi:hypothetical protein
MSQIPTRLLILERLTALLEGVEYEYDDQTFKTAGAVFRGRNLLGDESKPWPIISIMESPASDISTFGAEENRYTKYGWTLLIQGICEAGVEEVHATDQAYYFYAATEVLLSRINAVKSNSGLPKYPDNYLLGKLITSVEIFAPVIRQADDKSSAAAFFFLPLRVGIATLIGEPYTQVSP